MTICCVCSVVVADRLSIHEQVVCRSQCLRFLCCDPCLACTAAYHVIGLGHKHGFPSVCIKMDFVVHPPTPPPPPTPHPLPTYMSMSVSMIICIAGVYSILFQKQTRGGSLFFILCVPIVKSSVQYLCVTIPPAVRPTVLQQMDVGSLTCAQIW